MIHFETSALCQAAFYRAFELGDLEAMMAVWATDADILCIHPMAPPTAGPIAIRNSWQEIFQGSLPRKFEIDQIGLIETAALCIYTVFETITLPLQRQRFTPLLATNVFRRGEHGWHLVLHHAGPQGIPETAPFNIETPSTTRH